jgi:hypothetical protein
VARSDSALGSSYASTMATVAPLPPEVDSLYALCRSLGPNPDGVAFGLIASALARSVRRRAKQLITAGLVAAAQERTVGTDPAAAGVVAARACVATANPPKPRAAAETAARPVRTAQRGGDTERAMDVGSLLRVARGCGGKARVCRDLRPMT